MISIIAPNLASGLSHITREKGGGGNQDIVMKNKDLKENVIELVLWVSHLGVVTARF